MKEFEDAFMVFSSMAIPFCIGVGVAIARVAKHGWLGFAYFLREFSLCCFYGVIMYWLLDLYDLPPTVKYGITGGGVYLFLELGNTIFNKLERMINDFQLADFCPWLRKRGPKDD